MTPVLVRDALARPAVESARALQVELADRVEYEQKYLPEVLGWAGCGGEPLFNTFVNILSHEGPGRGGPPPASTSDTLFVPWQIGETTIDTETSTATTTTTAAAEIIPTPISTLDTAFLADKNLYLDVVRRLEDDCVDFAIRCDGSLMDEGAARAFAEEVAREVGGIVEEIQRQEEGGGGSKGREVEVEREGEGGGEEIEADGK